MRRPVPTSFNGGHRVRVHGGRRPLFRTPSTFCLILRTHPEQRTVYRPPARLDGRRVGETKAGIALALSEETDWRVSRCKGGRQRILRSSRDDKPLRQAPRPPCLGTTPATTEPPGPPRNQPQNPKKGSPQTPLLSLITRSSAGRITTKALADGWVGANLKEPPLRVTLLG